MTKVLPDQGLSSPGPDSIGDDSSEAGEPAVGFAGGGGGVAQEQLGG